MNKDVEDLLSQLTEAMNGAKRFVRTIYVYKSGRTWWVSGKLPKDINVFYVAYPNGEVGRSEVAPDIDSDDWKQFCQAHDGQAPIFGEKPEVPALKEPQRSRGERMFKFFLWYAAFAPYLQFMLCLILGPLFLGMADSFDFAAKSVLFAIPVTVVYAVMATTPKTFVQSTIGIEAHIAFLAVVGFFSLSGKAGSYQHVIGMMLVICMAASAASLLMVIDILEKNECQTKK